MLRRKREALVAELFRLARPAIDARSMIAERGQESYVALLRALALHGDSGLTALGWPTRDVRLTMRATTVWGIQVAEIVEKPSIRRTLAARATPPGTAGLAGAVAASRFEALVDLLVDAAPRELLIRRLGDALARTSRQVNTLEQRLAPTLDRHVATLRHVLDEREREEKVRLRHLVRRIGSA